jgi:hypothetical protein
LVSAEIEKEAHQYSVSAKEKRYHKHMINKNRKRLKKERLYLKHYWIPLACIMYILQFPKWGRKKRIWNLRKVKVIASLIALKQLWMIADLEVSWSALLRELN